MIVDGEGLIGVVDAEDPIGSGADMEHEDLIDAEEEIAKTRMAAAGPGAKRVVDGDVAAVGSARVDGWWIC